MTPAANSAKALRQNRLRPTAHKPIVPAIPLTYVQKRQKKEVALAQMEAQAPVSAPVVTAEQPPSPVTQDSPVEANDALEVKAPEEESEQASPLATIGFDVDKAVTQSPEDESEVSAQGPLSEDRQQTPRTDPSDGQSSTSRSTFQMPPASFLPSGQSHFPPMNFDSANFPPQQAFNIHPPMHHTHPSTGSVRFGAYGESNNSSPAPPLSAENAPPFPFQQMPQHAAARYGSHQSNGGPPGHSYQLSNGFSPMGPPAPPPGYYPRQDGLVNPGLGADNFARRQTVSFAPPDGYSPSNTHFGVESQRFNAYDPSTPHSFQGSQSSAPNEPENGLAFHARPPTAAVSNGNNGHVDDVRLYQQPPRPSQRPGSQILASGPNMFSLPPSAQPPMGIDHLDGLVSYLQSQFANNEFSDYTLELRFADDRAPPVRIPGHALLFARSPALKFLMEVQAQENESGSNDMASRSIFIESDDPFLRPDSFWMAMQRLYGAPLLDVNALTAMSALPNTQLPSPIVGTPADRFDAALGYAAAGHLLQIPPVTARGIEMATHFVNWATIEKAFDFSLHGGLDSEWTLQGSQNQSRCPSTYGPAVNVLIHQSLNFIIQSFPPNFELDVSAGDFNRSRRLPAVTDERPTTNPRLSFIKFGDHPTEESIKSTNANADAATLSKVLLNLPFHLLKYVLESPRLGNVQGWATTGLRQKVMHAVVEEREKRRTRVRSNIQVTSAKRKDKAWETVGWQEAVEALGGNEATPTLTRTWVDFLLQDHERGSA